MHKSLPILPHTMVNYNLIPAINIKITNIALSWRQAPINKQQ